MRSSSAPRACPGGVEEVSCSPVSKKGWLGSTLLEGAEQKEATGSHQRGDHGRGGDGWTGGSGMLAENQPLLVGSPVGGYAPVCGSRP